MTALKPSEILSRAATFLDGLADRLDGWATDSRTGGWSTHQVDANRSTADECRREASALRKASTLALESGE